MTPKKDIFSLEANNLLTDVFPQIEKKGFSRVPIYSKTPENITGVLHMWDIVRLPEKEYSKTRIDKIARNPFFVFSSENIGDLLVELRKNDSHMAIVLNEDKKFEGIITVEDLLEEIVGDIAGEVSRG